MIVIGKNRATMLPVLLCCCLLGALLFAGCRQEEKKASKQEEKAVPRIEGTIIAVGDSLTAGYGLREDEAYPALLEEKLRKNGYNWQVINAGVSGETSSGALSRIKWIISRRPAIVILETGANDGLRGIPVSLIRENIEKTVALLQEAHITVLLAGMQIVRNLGAEYGSDFAAVYPAVAKEHNLILIPFFLEGVAAKPELNQEDTIHPNAAGYKIVTENVYPYVVQAIEKARGKGVGKK